jgi:hypothetical protein
LHFYAAINNARPWWGRAAANSFIATFGDAWLRRVAHHLATIIFSQPGRQEPPPSSSVVGRRSASAGSRRQPPNKQIFLFCFMFWCVMLYANIENNITASACKMHQNRPGGCWQATTRRQEEESEEVAHLSKQEGGSLFAQLLLLSRLTI